LSGKSNKTGKSFGNKRAMLKRNKTINERNDEEKLATKNQLRKTKLLEKEAHIALDGEIEGKHALGKMKLGQRLTMRKSLTQNKTGTRTLDISRKDKEKTKDNLINSESHSDGSAGGGHHSDGHGDFDPPSLSVKNHITEMKLKTSMAVETDAAVRNDAEQAQREKTSARVAAKKRHNRVKKQFGAVISRVKVLNMLGAHMHNASDEKQSVISQDDDKASLHSAPSMFRTFTLDMTAPNCFLTRLCRFFAATLALVFSRCACSASFLTAASVSTAILVLSFISVIWFLTLKDGGSKSPCPSE
jgi:hypothetical protein